MLEVEYELPPFGELAQLTNLLKKRKKIKTSKNKHLEQKKEPHVLQNCLRENSYVI